MVKKTLTLIVFLFSILTWSQTNPIRTKWRTFVDGNENVILVPMNGTYTYKLYNSDNIKVDESTNVLSGDKKFFPLSAGDYYLEITPATANTFKFVFADNPSFTLIANARASFIELSDWGTSTWNTNLSYMFMGCSNLQITATNAPNLTGVTNLTGMFREASKVNANFNNWDISSVKDVSRMFYKAKLFNGNISNWNTSKVENMTGMFAEADSFNQNLNTWDVSKVKDMSYMFSTAKVFNGDISTWNTLSVENMSNMFFSAAAFNGVVNTNLSLNYWRVDNVTNMESMFNAAKLFNQELNNWNVAKVINMKSMFMATDNFNQPLNLWNVGNVTSMSGMFRSAKVFNQELNSWNVAKVKDMSYMFYIADKFNKNINTWNTANVETFKQMFNRAKEFNQDISNFNFGSVTDASMFLDDSGLNCINYSTLLHAIANQSNLPPNISFSAKGVKYGPSTVLARDYLMNNKNWSISSDIFDSACDDSFLSVDDDIVTTSNKVTLYPNPIADNLNIQSKEDIKYVNIYSIDGKLLNSYKENTINMTNYAKGMYVVKITFINGVTHNEKVIKK